MVVLDINESRIKAWNSDKLPIFEPGLEDVVKDRPRNRNLFFSTEVHKHVGEADIVFVRCAIQMGAAPPAGTGIGMHSRLDQQL